ncbi:MAG TPA: hypothetical protein VLL48_01295, partial [Longimicrobiales bacterium]|nr:hypothetical protein [Longimicrobiales bacterium]
EIAEVLGVGSILEGTVQRADERVRVTVTLVDVATDRQLWSETFDRELNVENLFAVEGEIAREVATALQIELGQTAVSLAGQAPASLEAHDLYLLGLYHWNRRTGDEMLRAAGFFRESAALDPDYALAHAGLANTYVLLPLYAGVSAHEAMPSARAAARRALALDPTLAEAHAALAMVRTVYDFAWEEAETSFRRALELSPSYATGHQWYAVLLDVRGRFGEARTHHERALALDPLSGIINETYGNHLIFTEQYDRARVQLRHTLELLPDLPLALLFLGEVDLLTGAFDDAERTLRRWATVTGHEPEPWSRVVAGMRDPDAMGDAMQALSGLGEAGVLSPYWQAQYHALLEDRDEAVQALRRGMEERDFLMFFVSVDPAFNALRNDEGFRDAMAEMIPRGTGGDD